MTQSQKKKIRQFFRDIRFTPGSDIKPQQVKVEQMSAAVIVRVSFTQTRAGGYQLGYGKYWNEVWVLNRRGKELNF
jgi:hypothetical protein